MSEIERITDSGGNSRMSRFTEREIAFFKAIGGDTAEELDERTWCMHVGNFLVIRVTRQETGIYEVFCADDEYNIQIEEHGLRLYDTVRGAIFRYNVAAMVIDDAVNDIQIIDKEVERLV